MAAAAALVAMGGARPGAQSREERGGEVGAVLAMQLGGRRAEQG